MTRTVAFPTPISAVAPAPPQARPVEPVAGARPDPKPQSQAADLRLVIEEDEGTGSFVYKVFDRRTGEVVRQLPREEVLRLRQDPGYAPGKVIAAEG